VAVVPFASFVVVTQHTYAINDERQPILERMFRIPYRPGQPPNDDLSKRPDIEHVPFIDQQFRAHVGQNNNTDRRCQLLQHSPRASRPA